MNKLSTDDRRRALALVGERPDGCTTALLYKQGIKPMLITKLLTAGFATAEAKRTVGGDIENVQVRITDAGRVAVNR
jgi:hypothetical protein